MMELSPPYLQYVLLTSLLMGHSRFMATIESIEVQVYFICVRMIAVTKGST